MGTKGRRGAFVLAHVPTRRARIHLKISRQTARTTSSEDSHTLVSTTWRAAGPFGGSRNLRFLLRECTERIPGPSPKEQLLRAVDKSPWMEVPPPGVRRSGWHPASAPWTTMLELDADSPGLPPNG